MHVGLARKRGGIKKYMQVPSSLPSPSFVNLEALRHMGLHIISTNTRVGMLGYLGWGGGVVVVCVKWALVLVMLVLVVWLAPTRLQPNMAQPTPTYSLRADCFIRHHAAASQLWQIPLSAGCVPS